MNQSPFHTILTHFRKSALSERDKGDKFERLIQAYLQTDPRYAALFTNVWLWNDFPARRDFGGKDTGIDLVARTTSGDYWAIQCKCYQESAVIDKAAVDSFISTSSKNFKDDQLRTIGFAHRLWISTTNRWGGNADTTLHNLNLPFSRLGLQDLENASVDWGKLSEGLSGEASRAAKKSPMAHQVAAISAAHEHFKTSERGKLIMACGTGKTFTSLQIAEKETNGKGVVLFLVPSIALLGQTLREWTADAQKPFNAICICSDSNVSRKRSKNEDSDGFSVVDLALPASTDVKGILKQFAALSEGMTSSHPLTSHPNIPALAYEYPVNGKSAIEWVMERYAITTHKESGIRNDPNDWAVEVGNPRYILDLLLSVIRLSVETVEVVRGLPGSGFVEVEGVSPF